MPIDVLRFDATHVECRVTCDAGFYMRAFAHDLGAALGCGACLEALRRECNGAFDLRGAVPLEEIDARGPAVADRMVPLDELLPEVPCLVLTEHGVRRARHGNDLTAADVIASSTGVDGAVDVRWSRRREAVRRKGRVDCHREDRGRPAFAPDNCSSVGSSFEQRTK